MVKFFVGMSTLTDQRKTITGKKLSTLKLTTDISKSDFRTNVLSTSRYLSTLSDSTTDINYLSTESTTFMLTMPSCLFKCHKNAVLTFEKFSFFLWELQECLSSSKLKLYPDNSEFIILGFQVQVKKFMCR